MNFSDEQRIGTRNAAVSLPSQNPEGIKWTPDFPVGQYGDLSTLMYSALVSIPQS